MICIWNCRRGRRELQDWHWPALKNAEVTGQRENNYQMANAFLYRTAIPAPALLDEGDRVLSFPSLWRTWLLPLGLLHLKLQTSQCTRREHVTSSEKTCEALETSISQQLQWKNDTDSWCVFHCPSSRRHSVVSHSKLPNPGRAYSKLQTDTVWCKSRPKITEVEFWLAVIHRRSLSDRLMSDPGTPNGPP